MWERCLIFLIVQLAVFKISARGIGLEQVDDTELVNLLNTEKYVIVLFTKNACEQCDKLENELINIREELVDELNGWVVKVKNSNLVQTYSPSKEPAVLFIRHGVPLLYSGPIDEEHILHTFRENKEPLVRELDDSNFEHLTQASSGATTGDWFILFYSKACVASYRMTARWEAVAAALKTRLNVARVNRQEGGAATARRFKVYNTPSFVLFRQGKLYRYDLPSHDVPNLIHFATEGFKKIARAEPVPVPQSPFDDLTQMIADYLAENTWLFGVGGICLVLGIIAAAWSRRTAKPSKRKEKEKKKVSSSKSRKAE